MADVPEWLQALILGVVQGVTEFVPVSSSGHLVVIPHLLGWERPGLAFDVALHLGTLGAIIAYFHAELAAMARGLLAALRRGDTPPDARAYRRVALLLALATIPVAIAGWALKSTISELFENPPAAAGFLLVTAVLLIGGERLRSRRAQALAPAPVAGGAVDGDGLPRAAEVDPMIPAEIMGLPLGADPSDPAGLTLDRIGARQALVVGLFQMLALCPGISRSGSTIAAGMGAGMTREAATRFSFLLALPALAGAALLSAPDLFDPAVTAVYAAWEIALGVAAAFVSSYLAIRYLVALVARDRLTMFAGYCVVASAVGVTGHLLIG